MALSNRKVMSSKEATPRSSEPASLFRAARLDDVEMFDEALESGQSINEIHPQTGKTPLHVAAAWGSERVVDRISQLPNADPWVTDKAGHTAFDYSVKRNDGAIKTKISGMMDRADMQLTV